MRITCNYDRCTSNGLCESNAPDYFELDENADLQILREEVDPADLPDVENAVTGCPTQALELVD